MKVIRWDGSNVAEIRDALPSGETVYEDGNLVIKFGGLKFEVPKYNYIVIDGDSFHIRNESPQTTSNVITTKDVSLRGPDKV